LGRKVLTKKELPRFYWFWKQEVLNFWGKLIHCEGGKACGRIFRAKGGDYFGIFLANWGSLQLIFGLLRDFEGLLRDFTGFWKLYSFGLKTFPQIFKGYFFPKKLRDFWGLWRFCGEPYFSVSGVSLLQGSPLGGSSRGF